MSAFYAAYFGVCVCVCVRLCVRLCVRAYAGVRLKVLNEKLLLFNVQPERDGQTDMIDGRTD